MLNMPKWIASPTTIPVPGGKRIDEFAGRVNTGDPRLSIAHMHSPPGWSEPGQRPEFDEWTLVLRGMMRVEYQGGVRDVAAGEAILTEAGEWIRYSTPGPEGCDYIAVCLPAFSIDTVHRDR
ncbi:MAG: cupin domain-containing protein [Bryobacter sp.]|jgi:mannose-6-phosphate isomerase-like protein (cupin superfamily)|nr:cupin domain-containing protein [Bryobacter sp. CoA8 C33]